MAQGVGSEFKPQYHKKKRTEPYTYFHIDTLLDAEDIATSKTPLSARVRVKVLNQFCDLSSF
jgi:hypothetical protein